MGMSVFGIPQEAREFKAIFPSLVCAKLNPGVTKHKSRTVCHLLYFLDC